MSSAFGLAEQALTPTELGKLQWRSRRGMLENDLLLERFYARHKTLTRSQADALTQLLELSDNDLLDLLMGRKPLPKALAAQDAVRQILGQLQAK